MNRSTPHRLRRWLAASAVLLLGSASGPVPDSYRAAWETVRLRLERDIERHRKSDATLEIVDADGRPVSGAALDVRQRRHEFFFGCNALVVGQLGELNQKYEQAFADLFNLATTTFCWSAVEPEPGRLRFAEGSEEIWRRPPPDRIVAFGKRHGLALKGQPLLADSWHPAWAPADPAEVKRLYGEWFDRVARRYGDDFQIWDVVNESQLCARRSPRFPLYSPDLAYVDWAFRQAQRRFPAANLLAINENTSANLPVDKGNAYYRQVKALVESGAGVEGIGFQFHLFNAGTLRAHLAGKTHAPGALLAAYDAFGAFGLPLFITEITIPTTLEDGEAVQAEVLANLYRLWFSVPRMAGITYWNLCDGAAWKGEGKAKAGLVDEQINPKPAYRLLHRLIHRDWTTRLALRTDPSGKAVFRGFRGRYRVTVTAGGRPHEFDVVLARCGPVPRRLTLKR